MSQLFWLIRNFVILSDINIIVKSLFKISSSIILYFLLFEIQFEFSIESFLATKLGNSPIIPSFLSGKFTFSLEFNIVLSRGLSFIFSGE